MRIRSRLAKTSIVLPALALFAVPQIAILLTQASFLTLANESIGYRYFFASRLAAGEGGTVWLPQGQLTSLVQLGIYQFLLPISGPFPDVWDSIEAFGLLYGLTLVALFGVILVWVVLDGCFSVRDAFLVAAVPVAIAYLLGRYLNYTTQPDYQHWNMVLFTAAAALFVYFKCRSREGLSLGNSTLVGAFLGLCLANKLSMPLIAAAAASPLAVEALGKRDWRGVAIFALYAPLTAAAVFIIIMLGLYGFHWDAVQTALHKMATFAANPGPPEGWFGAGMFSFLWSTHYLQAAVAAALALVVAACLQDEKSSLLLISLLALTGVAFIALVWYRPAGSTAFDAGCAMITLTAMTLTLLPHQTFGGHRVVVLAAILVTLGWINFRPDFLMLLKSSGAVEAAHLDFLRQAEAAGHPIITVIPDDRWAVYGPLPAILKGLSEFPTWRLPPERKGLIPVSVPLSFRTTYIGKGPDETYPAEVTLMWEDFPDLPELTELYPALKAAADARRCQARDLVSHELVSRMWLCLQAK